MLLLTHMDRALNGCELPFFPIRCFLETSGFACIFYFFLKLAKEIRGGDYTFLL